MFKNFHNSLNSLEYQYSVHNSLLHLAYILTFKARLHHVFSTNSTLSKSVCLSVHQTRALWLNESNFCPHFYTIR